jgi:DNA-binding beta-propeller fold protein YncE
LRRYWIPLLAGLAVVLLSAPAGLAMWHCGDIDLPAVPQQLLADPITGDFLVATDAAQVIRIDEATYEIQATGLAAGVTALALDPGARELYAVHGTSGTVTILDMATGDTSLVAVGYLPAGIVADALRGAVYVMNSGDSTISVIQGAVVIDTVRCPGAPVAMAIDPLSGRGFVTLTDANLLFAFDISSGDTAHYATGPAPSAIEVDPEKGELYIANTTGNSLTVFRIDADSTFTVPLASQPSDLALNPETGHLFVATASGVVIVDTDTYSTTTVSLPSAPADVAIDALSDRGFVSLAGQGLIVEIGASGDTLVTAVGGNPGALLVNPVTNKCYVANQGGQSISVLDASNYSRTSVPSLGGPGPIVVNIETHQVYTPNFYAGTVTIIDGYTNATSKLRVADGPNGVRVDPVTDDVYVVCAWGDFLAVKRSGLPDTLLAHLGRYAHGLHLNPNTGKAYVTNRFSRDMSIVDMATLDTTLVRVGAYPCAVDVNLDHNKIYVCNRLSWSIAIVDGATNALQYKKVGKGPIQLEINPVTNMVFNINPSGRSVTAMDCTTLEQTVIPAGTNPSSVSINTNTNTIYITSRHDGEVLVVDGDTFRRRPANADYGIGGINVDPWFDRAFTASWDWGSVTVIDGNFLSSIIIPVGEEPHDNAFDPVLEKLYVTNHGTGSVDIIQMREKISPRTEVVIDTLAGDVAYTPTPTISGTATSLRTPRNYGIMKVLYKVDNLRGPWQEATVTGSGPSVNWHLTTPPMLIGSHLIFVTAIDSTASTLSSSSTSSVLRISNIACYEFTCLSPPPEAPVADPMADITGAGELLSWTDACGDGGWYELEISRDPTFATIDMRLTDLREPAYMLGAAEMETAPFYWRVVSVDYPHGKRSEYSPVYSIAAGGTPGDAGPLALAPSLRAYPNPSRGSVILRVTGPGKEIESCSIYDVTGRLLTVVPMMPSDKGMAAVWDGTDPDGRPVPPGVYYARVRGSEPLEHKIVLIR